MIAAVGLNFRNHLIMLPVIGNGVGVRVRVYDDDATLAMGWHFGNGGGCSIAFVSVVT